MCAIYKLIIVIIIELNFKEFIIIIFDENYQPVVLLCILL